VKPINIYELTRLTESNLLAKLERQMSGRTRQMRIKEWEVEGLRRFSERLCALSKEAHSLKFFYSFTMPKLGKEFDLIRISDELIVNIELKSGGISDETIRKQLLQNKYYLATLGKNMVFYTYVDQKDRLVRLSNSGRLVEAAFEELVQVLDRQGPCYCGNIEELFKEDKYLISPLTDPGRFLRREYFLTFQQRDIKKQILKNVDEGIMLQGFTGLPGTGKTILLYDIAMHFSNKESVCFFYFGAHKKELTEINERLKRVDFYCYDAMEGLEPKRYSVILVDEAHRIEQKQLQQIIALSKEWNAPVIFSYDNVECVSPRERCGFGAEHIENLPGFVGFKLTNRIRLNNELSTFIRTAFHADNVYKREYPSVSVAYARDDRDAQWILSDWEKEGYVFIEDSSLGEAWAFGREYDKVCMLIDESFYYDEQSYLRSDCAAEGYDSAVLHLFHGLSRAKKQIGIVVKNNKTVLEALLYILQK